MESSLRTYPTARSSTATSSTAGGHDDSWTRIWRLFASTAEVGGFAGYAAWAWIDRPDEESTPSARVAARGRGPELRRSATT